jgi:hypothetical protein
MPWMLKESMWNSDEIKINMEKHSTNKLSLRRDHIIKWDTELMTNAGKDLRQVDYFGTCSFQEIILINVVDSPSEIWNMILVSELT